MAINLTDFDKIWASTSPLTPYTFTDANYQEGWNFVGNTPPARQMWDGYMKWSDEKQQYIVNNFLPLNGGTMTGTLTLADGGTALSDATVGTVLTNSISETVSLSSGTGTELTSVDCTAGTWVVTGHIRTGATVSGKVYACSVSTTSGSVNFASDGVTSFQASSSTASPLQTAKIFVLATDSTIYLNGYANESASVTNAEITAVRIK